MGQTYEARKLAKQGLRKCKRCEQILELERFYKSPSKDWYDSYCLECKSLNDKDYREKDPDSYKAKLRQRYKDNREHYRDLARRSIYGVPLGTFELLYEMQDGKCAICGAEKSTVTGRELAIDHDNGDRSVRGLLCTPCNLGIGSFKHNTDLLERAIAYLLKDGFTIDELKSLLRSKLTDFDLSDLGV